MVKVGEVGNGGKLEKPGGELGGLPSDILHQENRGEKWVLPTKHGPKKMDIVKQSAGCLTGRIMMLIPHIRMVTVFSSWLTPGCVYYGLLFVPLPYYECPQWESVGRDLIS